MSQNLKLQVLLSALDKATGPMRSAMQSSRQLAGVVKETKTQLDTLKKTQVKIDGMRVAIKQARDATTAFNEAKRKVQDLARQMAAGGGGPELARKLQQARTEVSKLAAAQAKANEAAKASRAALEAASVNTKRLAEAERTLQGRTRAASSELERQRAQLEQLAAAQKKMTAARESYDRTMSARNNLAGTGAGMVAAGGGTLMAAQKFMMPGYDFDASQSKVQALTRLDKDSADMKMLRQQARELGAATNFTAGDAAEGQAFLAMAGFTPAAIQKSMPGMLDLARAGGIELGRAADIASNILTGFKMPADDMERLGDVLTGTFTRSNVTMEMLSETMKYSAPVAAGLGVDLETAAAMTGKLGDAGVQGSIAGTALSAIMLRLAAPPKKAAKALEALGMAAPDEELKAVQETLENLSVTVADAEGNMRSMPDILAEIGRKTKDMGDVERAAIYKAIAGQEAVKAMFTLTDQAMNGGLQTFRDTLKKTQGESAAVAKTMADNLKGDLKSMESAWEDLGIEVFDVNNGALREVSQSITGIIRDVSAWAKANPELVGTLSKIVLVGGALVAVIGGLLLMAAAVLGPFAMLKFSATILGFKALPMLGSAFGVVGGAVRALTAVMLANPILAIIAAIALAAYLIYDNWDWVKAQAIAIWAEIQKAFDGGLVGILALIVNWSPIGLFYKAFAAVLSYLGIELPGNFTQFGSMIWGGLVNGLTAGLSAVQTAISSAATSVMTWFKEVLGINSPSTVFASFGGFLMDGLVAGIGNALGAVKDAVVNAGSSVIGWFKEKLGIASPSRVFRTLGGFTMEGLDQGLEQGTTEPLKTLSSFTKKMTAAGAGLALGAMPAMGALPPLDTRPPLTAAVSGSAADGGGGMSVQITINAAPGMDEQAIARMVVQKLEEAEKMKTVRKRSRLTDDD